MSKWDDGERIFLTPAVTRERKVWWPRICWSTRVVRPVRICKCSRGFLPSLKIHGLVVVLSLCGGYGAIWCWLAAEFTLRFTVREMKCPENIGSSSISPSYFLFVFWSIIFNGMFSRFLRLAIHWINAHQYYSMEFEEEDTQSWVILCTWHRNSFRHKCVSVIDRFASCASSEPGVLGHVIGAIDTTVPFVLIVGVSNVLSDGYAANIGSGNKQKLINFPLYNLRLLNGCLQKSSSSVFWSLDAFALTEFMVTRSMGA